MPGLFIWTIMISSILLATALAAKPSLPHLVSHACELGVVRPWATVSCDALIENNSAHDVVFTQMASQAANATINNLPIRVPGKGRAKAHLVFHVRGQLGKFSLAADLATKKLPDEPLRVSAHGFSYSRLDEAGSRLDFGEIEADQQPTQHLGLTSTDDRELHATRILECPAFLHCRLDKTGRTLSAEVSPDTHWGLQTGHIGVALSTKDEPRAQFQASANVRGQVQPASNPLSFGMRSTGLDSAIPLQITSASGTDFRVGDISLSGLEGKVQVKPCEPSAPGCKQLQLRIADAQPAGFVNGNMSIELPDFATSLDVQVAGILTRPAPKRAFDASGQPAEQEAPSTTSSPDTARPSSYTSRARQESASLPPPEPPGQGPVLRWSVANEQPLYGYLIYRAKHKDGPWQRVNDQIIPVLGHDDSASQYAWRDTSAVKGSTYWYFIKTLANDGSKKKLTEAQKVVAR